jgi:hypothetical protein
MRNVQRVLELLPSTCNCCTCQVLANVGPLPCCIPWVTRLELRISHAKHTAECNGISLVGSC